MTAPPRTRPYEHAPYRERYVTVATAPEPDTQDSAEQKFSLSATQVAASMTAAITAALVGSRLGVAGTVIGAGLASVISVVGGAIIGHSILLTRKQVKRAVLQVRGAEPSESAVEQLPQTVVLQSARPSSGPVDDHTVVIPAVTRLDLERASRDTRPGPGQAEPGRPRPRLPQGGTGPVLPRTRRRVSTGVLLGVGASLAIFASVLGVVTVAETIKGTPLGGGESGGLTVLGGNPIAATATSTAVVTEPSTVTQTVTEVTAPGTTAPATTAPSASAPSSGTEPQSTSTSTSASTRPSPSTPPSSSQTPASAGATPAAAANSAPSAEIPAPAVATGQAGQR